MPDIKKKPQTVMVFRQQPSKFSKKLPKIKSMMHKLAITSKAVSAMAPEDEKEHEVLSSVVEDILALYDTPTLKRYRPTRQQLDSMKGLCHAIPRLSAKACIAPLPYGGAGVGRQSPASSLGVSSNFRAI